ncbi:hypothetical protein DFJ69_6169 [Thermomonospora umbrina]|uniref:Uncharacterized protein n=1 Tax=Thermomonospora umbrina TaxID=111806 RepID=A0A3D9T2M8_9ACTN|nr:hypothetical protein DFJ69_6169 [Thermomonospora umbrina]
MVSLAHRAVLLARPPQFAGIEAPSVPDVVGRARLDDAAGEGAFRQVRQAVLAWLGGRKAVEATLSSGLHQLDERRTLAVANTYADDGTEAATRIQLNERNDSGFWSTTMTACTQTHGGLVISVELECADLAHGVHPQPPGLIRELLDVLPVCDGPSRLTRMPIAIHAEYVDYLRDVLMSPDRRMPVLVAAKPLAHHGTWERRWRDITRGAAGMASLYLLTDLAAVDAFRGLVYEYHRVAPGAVRTFLPEVDPAWRADGHRHRVLSFGRLSDRADHAWSNVVGSVQQMSRSAAVPPSLNEVTFPGIDSETAARARRHALDAAADTGTGEGDLRAEIAVLTGLLTEADTQISDLTAGRERLARQLAAAADAHRRSEDDLDLQVVEHMETLAELDQARAELKQLRSILHRRGRSHDAHPHLATPSPPAGFEELLDRIGDLPLIAFTAERRRALELDDTDARRAPVWAGKAWQALRALNSYAEHSTSPTGFPGDFYAFCHRPPIGAEPFPANKVAMDESDRVQNHPAWAKERMLPVPPVLDPTGVMLMTAHIKLESRGSISPRIYFVDNTAGPTGQIIIGFIGRHLTNTMT